MTLEPRNNTFRMVSGAVRSISRWLLARRVVEKDNADTGKIAFMQVKGDGDPGDPDNQDVLQEDDVDHVQHYGFESYPAADTELIGLDADGGSVVIGERDAVPKTLGDLAQGDVRLYDSAANEILLDADTVIRITCAVGNVELYAKAGSIVKLGNDSSATYRKAAYAHTTEAGASKVASGTTLDVWTGNVLADITAIKADLLALVSFVNCLAGNAADVATTIVGSGPVSAVCGFPAAPTLAPLTLVDISTGTNHSYVSTGSDAVEVEEP